MRANTGQHRGATTSDPFLRKLETFGPLPEADKEMIRSLSMQVERFDAATDIIREGEKPSDVNLVTGGFAYRYKLLAGGNRQIVAYLMPGDICDLHVSFLKAMDHSIAALTDTQIVKLPRDRIEELLDRPAISRALLTVIMTYEANGREWLANIGQRPAEKRVAHFLCEWHFRLRSIGLASDNECEFPLTQQQLGETTGLSSVHVNRVLQSLRRRKLIEMKSRWLLLPDLDRLWDISGFRSNYLHMQGM